MPCSNLARRRRLPSALATIVLAAASVASITSASANEPPMISGQPPTVATVDVQYSFRFTASDPERKKVRFSIANKPVWASFSASNGRLSGTPRAAHAGSTYSNITISATDGSNTVSLPAFSITVQSAAGSNSAPMISGAPATSVTAGGVYSFQPSASDVNNDPLTFSVTNAPIWATFSTGTGRLSGTPTAVHVGSYPNIVISVSDGNATAALPAFAIAVNAAPNAAPVISGSPSTAVLAGKSYTFTPSANDPDRDTLGYSIQNRPIWATFSTTTGRLSGTPTSAHVGSYPNIVISVSDGKATAALPAFAIAVNVPANTAPVISGLPPTSVQAGSAYSFRPTASDSDGDVLTFSIANRPAWATFNTATGQLAGTPTSADVGVYSNVLITVSDGKASTALPAFSIAVTEVSTGSATLSWTAPTTNTDGSALTNLAGYRIFYGTSPTSLSQIIQIANAGMTSAVIEGLSPATYYFAMRAYSSTGAESVDSNVTSKVVQ